MKSTIFKKTLSFILCAIIVTALAACQAKTPSGGDAAAVNLREKLASLMVSTDKLGLTGKYSSIAEIADGSVDPDLVGTWVMADGRMSYTYSADGSIAVKSEDYGDSEVRFTCLEIDGYQLICEELIVSPEFNDGVEEETTQLGYTAYDVSNDAMYMVTVEEPSEDTNSSHSTLVTMYRADENGSAAASMAGSPVAISTFDGTWATDKGELTITDGVLTLGGDSYTVSLDEKNQLVVEKDGRSTVYATGVGVMKEYDDEDRTQTVEKTMLSLNYTGTDENDKPNLLPVLDDWKTDYGWDSWYYTGSFELRP